MVSEGEELYENRSFNKAVLILVLVEDGLGDLVDTRLYENLEPVLILVLVEDGLGESFREMVVPVTG